MAEAFFERRVLFRPCNCIKRIRNFMLSAVQSPRWTFISIPENLSQETLYISGSLQSRSIASDAAGVARIAAAPTEIAVNVARICQTRARDRAKPRGRGLVGFSRAILEGLRMNIRQRKRGSCGGT